MCSAVFSPHHMPTLRFASHCHSLYEEYHIHFPCFHPALVPAAVTGLFLALSPSVTCNTGFLVRRRVSSLHHVVNERRSFFIFFFSFFFFFFFLESSLSFFIPFLSHTHTHTHTPAAPSSSLAVDPAVDRCWKGFQSPDTAAAWEKSASVFEYVHIIQGEVYKE